MTAKEPAQEKLTDYDKGFIAGLKAYAHWNHRIEYVGTSGTTLRKAIDNLKYTWNYNPGREAV